jgi:hypothetical protein
VVSHPIGCTGRIEVFAQHQTARLLEPQLLLELQGAHRRNGLEVMMQTRDAHSQFACEALDTKWLVEVLTKSLDRSGDEAGVESPYSR